MAGCDGPGAWNEVLLGSELRRKLKAVLLIGPLASNFSPAAKLIQEIHRREQPRSFQWVHEKSQDRRGSN
jgi:hypothetical protein